MAFFALFVYRRTKLDFLYPETFFGLLFACDHLNAPQTPNREVPYASPGMGGTEPRTGAKRKKTLLRFRGYQTHYDWTTNSVTPIVCSQTLTKTRTVPYE